MELMHAVADLNLISLDSSVFIYLYEKHPVYFPAIQPLFARLDVHDLRAVTSLVTLIEVLVLPMRQKRDDLVRIYSEAILNSSTVLAIPLDSRIAEKAANLRANYNLRTPDAIQIATAMTTGAQAFITNDTRLKSVHEIAVYILSDFVPR